jgi:hypothetical protein
MASPFAAVEPPIYPLRYEPAAAVAAELLRSLDRMDDPLECKPRAPPGLCNSLGRVGLEDDEARLIPGHKGGADEAQRTTISRKFVRSRAGAGGGFARAALIRMRQVELGKKLRHAP